MTSNPSSSIAVTQRSLSPATLNHLQMMFSKPQGVLPDGGMFQFLLRSRHFDQPFFLRNACFPRALKATCRWPLSKTLVSVALAIQIVLGSPYGFSKTRFCRNSSFRRVLQATCSWSSRERILQTWLFFTQFFAKLSVLASKSGNLSSAYVHVHKSATSNAFGGKGIFAFLAPRPPALLAEPLESCISGNHLHSK